MKETLDFLTDYFSTTNNTLVQNKLEVLKIKIEKKITKTKMDIVNNTKR